MAVLHLHNLLRLQTGINDAECGKNSPDLILSEGEVKLQVLHLLGLLLLPGLLYAYFS